MVHRVLPASILSLIIELRLVVGAKVLHLWVIHVSLLILLLVAHGRFLLAVFHYKLKHLELVFLHRAHMLHLLLVDPFCLLKHTTVVTLRVVVRNLNDLSPGLLRLLDHNLWEIHNFLDLLDRGLWDWLLSLGRPIRHRFS